MPDAPLVERRPTEVVRHGHASVDDYAWLRDRDDPAVIAYLEAENAHTKAVLGHTEDLQERLFDEIKSRIKQSDTSAPTPHDDWLYYRRTVEGEQYEIHCRRRAEHGAPPPDGRPDEHEQLLLDGNREAEGHDYFSLGALTVSPDHGVLAYAPDWQGSEIFSLRFRDLATGENLPDVIERRVAHGAAWANDNRTVYYTVQDDAHRPHQLWRHRLGTDPGDDELLMQEDDERFWMGVGRTRSGAFVVVQLGSSITSELYLIDADDPDAAPRVVAPREQGIEYSLDHRGDDLLITTNAGGAVDFKLVTAPVDSPGRDHWTELVGHRPGVRIMGVDAFAGHVAVYERTAATTRIRVLWPETGRELVVDQPEEVYTAGPGPNRHYDTGTLRYVYTSLVTPRTVYDLDVESGERTLVKRQEVPGGYDPSAYVTRREWATAPDGTEVPISVVHRADLDLDGSNPCLLYGYGSYEISIDPTFSPVRLSLLERGFVFAIGHPRGGGEMGRSWYEDGKFLAKPNTFTDFVACAEHLVARGYTSTAGLAIRGGSAGGLLIGAVLNLRPDLFGAAVAEVPFVDVLNTMFDATLPLTVIEYEEWGNPEEPEFFEVMRGYAPYENVRATNYPPMLVTAGINDPRVGFWEPAKWVAKLRVTKTDDNPLLLKTELGAGHFGPSGRYDAWRDESLVLAFLIDTLAPDSA